MKSCCYKTCNMSHIYHKYSTYLIGNFPELLKIYCSCISTCACYNHLRLTFKCKSSHLIIIKVSVLIYTVWYYMEVLSRHINW